MDEESWPAPLPLPLRRRRRRSARLERDCRAEMPEPYIQAFRAGIVIVCSLRCYMTVTTHDNLESLKCLKFRFRHYMTSAPEAP